MIGRFSDGVFHARLFERGLGSRESLVSCAVKLWEMSDKELCVGLRQQAETQVQLGKRFYELSLGSGGNL